MEVRKIVLAIVFCMLTAGMQAQETNQYIHKGLVGTMATLSVGHMPQHSINNVYIQGNAEYYLCDKISWRADGSFFLNNLNGAEVFQDNHNVFSGLSYHFPTKSKVDPYIGFQPGIAFSSSVYYDEEEVKNHSPTVVSPLISSVGGVNVYASQLFHVFAELRYVAGTHSAESGPQSLTEIRISFGLGFNIF
jgi:hypothetical protein